MDARSRRTQLRRWAVLPVSLLLAILGAIVVNNTDDLDALGIGLIVVAVLAAFVSTPPAVRSS